MKYDYKAVEAKWQKVWEDEKTFHAEIDHKKPKFYALVEFPYPSGAGLHVGLQIPKGLGWKGKDEIYGHCFKGDLGEGGF